MFSGIPIVLVANDDDDSATIHGHGIKHRSVRYALDVESVGCKFKPEKNLQINH